MPHEPAAARAPVARGRKLRRAVLALFGGLVAALVAGELLLRGVLFGDLELGGLGPRLRQPERYARGDDDEDYWKLVARFGGDAGVEDAPNPDAAVGWTGPCIAPGTYAHCEERTLGERRPVLLYGDSFAQCITPPEECFAALLEGSDLAQEHALLGYGVAGYGLDQIQLLIERSIDRFAARAPIVVVGVLVESDFERSVLGFRGWPKPRLELRGGELVLREPVEPSSRAYLDRHPPAIRSYLWRLFLHHRSPFLAVERERWSGVPDVRREKQELNLAILHAIDRSLSSRGIQHFFLAFHSEQGAVAPSGNFDWQERMLADFCAARGTRLVDTREYFALASGGDPARCARFYGHGLPLRGHHNALGNRVCFEALRDGILGDERPVAQRRIAQLAASGALDAAAPEVAHARFLGRDATLTTHGSQGALRVRHDEALDRLVLRADTSGFTELRFELDARATRFTARLFAPAGAPECPAEGLEFALLLDGEPALACPVPAADAPRALDVDLAGKRTLALVVQGDRGGKGCSWVCLDAPRLE